MCGSRKYSHPHRSGNFTKDPRSSLDFPFFKGIDDPPPPPLRIFHKYDIHPPAPPEMSVFEKNECSKSKAVMLLFISDRLLHIRRNLNA